jgi:hypothetical protein
MKGINMNLHPKTKQAVVFALILGISSIVASQLSGCGTVGDTGPQGPQGVTVVVPPSPAPNAVQTIVNDYNQWRVSNGQETIDSGLACTLYTVPQATTGITAAANGGVAPVLTNQGAFTYQGVFNQPNAPVSSGLNILPSGLKSVFQTYFIVKCTGYLVVATDDYHSFNLVSDDGSNLYVDGVLIVNDDGLHGAQSVTGQRHLQDTVHTFEVDFFQAGGQEELVVSMDNSLIPAANLYH